MQGEGKWKSDGGGKYDVEWTNIKDKERKE